MLLLFVHVLPSFKYHMESNYVNNAKFYYLWLLFSFMGNFIFPTGKPAVISHHVRTKNFQNIQNTCHASS